MGSIERILVMGAGPGGLANAAVLGSQGSHVTLFNRSLDRLQGTIRRGGVEIEGSLGEAFVPVPKITDDIEDAMKDAQLILIVVPAYGQMSMLDLIIPHLRPGQIIFFLCGSVGSLEGALRMKAAGIDLNKVFIGETATLPQSARVVGESKVRILARAKAMVRLSVFPGHNIDHVVETLGDTFKLNAKRNVLEPGLNNPNFLVHPAPMLLNYAAIERAEGMFSLMNEGMTDGVLRCLDAADAERTSIQAALGLEVLPVDDMYIEQGSSPDVYRTKGEPFKLRDRIWSRYIDEDVPYGSVMLSSLGRMIGVPTPVYDSINTIMSVVEQKDFVAMGRTVDKLGIAGLDREQLMHYLETGERP